MLTKIGSKKFLHLFSEIWESKDRRFCFVLGAGASRSSGIKTGGELAGIWLNEIKQMEDSEAEFDAFVEGKKITINNPGASYPDIYEERFKIDPKSGFEYINKELGDARPGYGYSVLAQILASKHHNIVITTNFDNLTEEALYTYTESRPLVCGHESLAIFAHPSQNRPLIVKIHRDRFFDPQSRPEEISAMNKLWVAALNEIFRTSIPIFIGYGGNDGSMMGYLEQVTKFDNIFWCERRGVTIPDRVTDFLDKKDGKLVEIEGFDEIMFLLQDKLKLPLLDKEIEIIAKSRADNYRETFEKIQKSQSASPDETVQAAAKNIVENAGDGWWAWALKAQMEQDPIEKNKIFQDALNEFPDSTGLYCNYANFLKDVCRDYDEVGRYYKKALDLDENSAINNGNYAFFLHEIRKSYSEAETFYNKALSLDPYNANNNGNYAIFLQIVRKSYDEAEVYFKRSLQLAPYNAIYNCGYAGFLKDIRNFFDKAEFYYKIALQLACDDANINGNYTGFLLSIGRKDEAVKFLEVAEENCYTEIVLAELYFYRYAHFEEKRAETFTAIKDLLCKGVRSPNFNLQLNVDRAIQDGHPDPAMLQRLADILTKDAPIGDLCDS